MKIYQHRNDLPIPLLSNLDNVSIKRVNPLMASNNKPTKQQSFDDDPWRLSSTPPNNNIFPIYQGNGVGDSDTAPTTTSNKNGGRGNPTKPANNTAVLAGNGNNAAAIASPDTKIMNQNGAVIAEPVIADKVSTQALIKASTESYQWFLDLDQITVSVAEKEGFLFTHVNYWVHSNQRQTSVRRRYSDFYWFWETLLKRYPFRVIPNLPPKKISGSKLARSRKYVVTIVG
jgi:hypothetical protein